MKIRIFRVLRIELSRNGKSYAEFCIWIIRLILKFDF